VGDATDVGAVEDSSTAKKKPSSIERIQRLERLERERLEEKERRRSGAAR
jgi:hypothetical protein